MKKCIIASDSFKGSLDSIRICDIAREKVHRFFPDCQVCDVPVADGGEGTVECFLRALKGERIEVTVHGPYMEPVRAFYGRFGKLAVIEMAAAAGLPLVGDNKDPARTTTYGVGELIRHAVDNGAEEIVLGIGGSSTNDGGCGAAAALGVRFTDEKGESFVPVGGTLSRICGIDASECREFLKNVRVTTMCDVQNPMHGEKGAACIFAPQKGADPETVKLLDNELKALDAALQKYLGIDSVADIPGTGAAGALGAGSVVFFGAQLKSGIDTVLDTVGFDSLLDGADMVFTGEGKLDSQSLNGKVVDGICRRARAKNVPVTAVVGDVGDDLEAPFSIGLSAIFSINRVALPFSQSKFRSDRDYADTFENIIRLMAIAEKM